MAKESSSSSRRQSLGRCAPRSRLGCATCKSRRVRCDEVHPMCGNCGRLQLDCIYELRSRRRQQVDVGRSQTMPDGSCQNDQVHNALGLGAAPVSMTRQLSQQVQAHDTRHMAQVQPIAVGMAVESGLYNCGDFVGQRTFDLSAAVAPERDDCFLPELGSSWAGEYSLFPEVTSPIDHSVNFFRIRSSEAPARSRLAPQPAWCTQDFESSPSAEVDSTVNPYPPIDEPRRPLAENNGHDPVTSSQKRNEANASIVVDEANQKQLFDQQTEKLIEAFRKVTQPPAAILIGGFERWYNLREYLLGLAEQSRAVRYALLCVVETLVSDNEDPIQPTSEGSSSERIFERHRLACKEISLKLTKHQNLKRKAREQVLAAVFLCAWLQVIRDQDSQHNFFPVDLAERIIVPGAEWNRYSQQLLAWMNTLDNKSHLCGQPLLSPAILHVVSSYPTQITSNVETAAGHSGCGRRLEECSLSESSISDGSPQSSQSCLESKNGLANAKGSSLPLLNAGRVKLTVLQTMIQPALEWYLTSQSYCRRISAFDKHHRNRFTPNDEFEVINACKDLEENLMELWDDRPMVISLNSQELTHVLLSDLAERLEEIFNVYLASFWILFVYLHRVCWWHLPHSPIAKQALVEVWRTMQRCYGEDISGGHKRIVHPALLWPVFLFGTECSDDLQEAWAMEQLQALGEAKTVLGADGTNDESLPPFRLSKGATRNAKRAAALLRALVKEQKYRGVRVDDRDLSIDLFGCYFSIV